MLLAQLSPADQALGGWGPLANLSAVVALIVFLGLLLFKVIPRMVTVVLDWAGKRDAAFTEALDRRDDTLRHIVDRAEAQAQLQREHNERQTRGLHEALDSLGAEMRGGSGNGHVAGMRGDRGSRG